MSDCIFLKLGGSLITDKRSPWSFRREVVHRLGAEIAQALRERRMRLLVGHGAGSFGHVAAREYRTDEGLPGGGGWEGCSETRLAVIELNRLLLETWREACFRPWSVAPSSCAWRDADGSLRMRTEIIERLFQAGQVPVIFGDVLLDEELGFSIASTEDLFAALAPGLNPARIILAGDVDGVFSGDPATDPSAQRIPAVSAANEADVLHRTETASAIDVTGGMAGKVRRLLALARTASSGEIRIISGLVPGAVRMALLGEYDAGTLICQAHARG